MKTKQKRRRHEERSREWGKKTIPMDADAKALNKMIVNPI
jgi:hypothetical protein